MLLVVSACAWRRRQRDDGDGQRSPRARSAVIARMSRPIPTVIIRNFMDSARVYIYKLNDVRAHIAFYT